jgi:hypothetical protein
MIVDTLENVICHAEYSLFSSLNLERVLKPCDPPYSLVLAYCWAKGRPRVLQVLLKLTS